MNSFRALILKVLIGNLELNVLQQLNIVTPTIYTLCQVIY